MFHKSTKYNPVCLRNDKQVSNAYYAGTDLNNYLKNDNKTGNNICLSS